MVLLSVLVAIACLAVFSVLGNDASFLRLVLKLAFFGCGHAVVIAAAVASAIADPTDYGLADTWNWAFWAALSPFLIALAGAVACTLPRARLDGVLLFELLACNVIAGDMVTHTQVVVAGW